MIVTKKMLDIFNTADMYQQGQGDEEYELSALESVNFPM